MKVSTNVNTFIDHHGEGTLSVEARPGEELKVFELLEQLLSDPLLRLLLKHSHPVRVFLIEALLDRLEVPLDPAGRGMSELLQSRSQALPHAPETQQAKMP